MNKTMKRCLSFCLAILLIWTLVPASAFNTYAEDTDPPDSELIEALEESSPEDTAPPEESQEGASEPEPSEVLPSVEESEPDEDASSESTDPVEESSDETTDEPSESDPVESAETSDEQPSDPQPDESTSDQDESESEQPEQEDPIDPAEDRPHMEPMLTPQAELNATSTSFSKGETISGSGSAELDNARWWLWRLFDNGSPIAAVNIHRIIVLGPGDQIPADKNQCASIGNLNNNQLVYGYVQSSGGKNTVYIFNPVGSVKTTNNATAAFSTAGGTTYYDDDTNFQKFKTNLATLEYVDISKLDMSPCKDMKYMFAGTPNLTEIKFPTTTAKLPTGSVAFNAVFTGCSKLTAINLGQMNASLSTVYAAFQDCSALKFLDITKWNFAAYSSAFGSSKGSPFAITVGSGTNLNAFITNNINNPGDFHLNLNSRADTATLSVAAPTAGLYFNSNFFAANDVIADVGGGDIDSSTWCINNIHNKYGLVEIQYLIFLKPGDQIPAKYADCVNVSAHRKDSPVYAWYDLNGTFTGTGSSGHAKTMYIFSPLGKMGALGGNLGQAFSAIYCKYTDSNGNLVTDFTSMLTHLKYVDMRGIDMNKITSLWRVLEGAKEMTTLILPETGGNVLTSLSAAFAQCYLLPSIDMSGWDLSHVSDLSWTFFENHSLTTAGLKLPSQVGGNGNLTKLNETFRGCHIMTEVDLSSWNLTNVTNMKEAFYYMPQLTSLKLPSSSLAKVTDVSLTFRYLPKLTELTIPDNFGAGVTDSALFASCFTDTNNLTRLTLGSNIPLSVFSTLSNSSTLINTSSPCNLLTTATGGNAYSGTYVSVTKPIEDGVGGVIASNGNWKQYFAQKYTADANTVSNVVVLQPGDPMPYGSVNDWFNVSQGQNTSPVFAWYDSTDSWNVACSIHQKNTVYIFCPQGRITVNSNTANGMFSSYSNASDATEEVVGYPLADIRYQARFAGLKTVDLRGMDLHSVTQTCAMFDHDASLTSVQFPAADYQPKSITRIWGMFRDCNNLGTQGGQLNMAGFNLGQVSSMAWTFQNCSNLTASNLTLPTGTNAPKNITAIQGTFSGCSKLDTLDLSSWDLSKVSNIDRTFNGCTSLTSLTLGSSFGAAVTADANRAYTFNNCNALKKLTVGSGCPGKAFATIPENNRKAMVLVGNGSLLNSVAQTTSTNNLGAGTYSALAADFSNVVGSSDPNGGKGKMDYNGWWKIHFMNKFGENKAVEHIVVLAPGAALPVTDFTQCANITSGGYGSVFAAYNETTKTATFFNPVGRVSIVGHPDDTTHKMKGTFSAVTDADIEGQNTNAAAARNPVDLANLQSVDLSGMNLSNVTSMLYTFDGDQKLETITFPKDTYAPKSVTDLSFTFRRCHALKELDLSDWNLNGTTTMQQFAYMRSLNPGSVGNDWPANALTKVTFPATGAPALTTIANAFEGCTKLTSVNFDGAWMSQTATCNMEGMLYHCTSLPSLDVSHFRTATVNLFNYTFGDLSSVTTITGLDKLNFTNATTIDYMFYNDSKLTSINLANVTGYGSKIQYTRSAFENCSKITSLNLSNWSFASMWKMANTFKNCTALSSLGLPTDCGANGVLDDMGGTFYLCKNLTGIDLTGWNLTKVQTMQSTFDQCVKLTTVKALNASTAAPTSNFYCCFRGNPVLTSVNGTNMADLSTWDMSKATYTTALFQNCTVLTKVIFPQAAPNGSLLEARVMFQGCSALTDVELGGTWRFASNSTAYTPNNGDFTQAFDACTALQTLDLSNWDLSTAKSIYGAFNNCPALKELILPADFGKNATASGARDGVFASTYPTTITVQGTETPYTVFASLANNARYATDANFTHILSGTGNVFPGVYSNYAAYNAFIAAGTGGTFPQNRKWLDIAGAKLAAQYPDWQVKSAKFLGTGDPVPTGYSSYVLNGTTPGFVVLTAAPNRVDLDKVVMAYYDSTDKSITFFSPAGPIQMPAEAKAIFSPAPNTPADSENGIYGGTDRIGTDTYTSHIAGILSVNDLHKVNSSNTVYIDDFIRGQTLIQSLDLSGMDLHNVEDMSDLCEGCTALTEIKFPTDDAKCSQKVKYFGRMFRNCVNLGTIDLHNFGLNNLIMMDQTFAGCTGLTSLSLPTSGGAALTSMKQTFERTALTQIDLSGWSLNAVTTMEAMCYGCNSLASLKLPTTGGNALTHLGYAFAGCGSLTKVDFSGWNFSKLTQFNNTFNMTFKFSVPYHAGTFVPEEELGASNEIKGNNHLMEVLLPTAVGKVPTAINDANHAFWWCDKLTSLDLSNWKFTGSVNAFARTCKMLKTVAIGDLSQATDISYLLAWCYDLETVTIGNLPDLDLSDTGKYEDFIGLAYPTTITIGSGMKREYLSTFNSDFSGYTLYPDLYRKTDNNAISLADDSIPAGTYRFTNVILDTDNTDRHLDNNGWWMLGVANTYFDAGKAFNASQYKIEHVEFLTVGDTIPAHPTKCANVSVARKWEYAYAYFDGDGAYGGEPNTLYFFSPYGNVITYETKAGNADYKSTPWGSAQQMFSSSFMNQQSSLQPYASRFQPKTLDLRNLDMTPAESIWQFAYNTPTLEEVWMPIGTSTAQITEMNSAFAGCTNLKKVHMADMSLANVYNLNGLFQNASSLQLVELPSGSKAPTHLVSMLNMFNNAPITSFTMPQGWAMGPAYTLTDSNGESHVYGTVTLNAMFSGCTALTTVDLSNLQGTANISEMPSLVDYCSSLTSITMPTIVNGKLTKLQNAFRGCTSLTTLDLSMVDMTKVTSMENMLQNCTSLQELTLPDLNSANITTTNTFTGDNALRRITIGQNMKVTYLTSLPGKEAFLMESNPAIALYVTGTNPDAGIYIRYPMLLMGSTWRGDYRCSSQNGVDVVLPQTDVKNIVFTADAYTGSDDFWNPCDIDGPKAVFKDGTITIYLGTDFVLGNPNSSEMFRGLKELTTVSGTDLIDTRIVTNLSMGFNLCAKLKSIDLHAWDTSNVTAMDSFFNGCSALAGVNLGGKFSVVKISNFSWFFWGCSALKELDLSNFNTASATNMTGFFDACSSLTELTFPSTWNTANVTTMQYLFMGCSNLEVLDLRYFDCSKVTNMGSAFSSCSKLKQITVSPSFRFVGTGHGFPDVNLTDDACFYCGGWKTRPATVGQKVFELRSTTYGDPTKDDGASTATRTYYKGTGVYNQYGVCTANGHFMPAGTTTKDGVNYYTIRNYGQLMDFGLIVSSAFPADLPDGAYFNTANVRSTGGMDQNASCILLADVQCPPCTGDVKYNYVPIVNPSGIFDGNGHTISGIKTIARDGNAGLIASATSLNRITNMTLDQFSVYPNGTVTNAGAFAGTSAGTFTNCIVKNSAISGSGRVACISGNGGTISLCGVQNSTVSGGSSLSGIANGGTITDCYADVTKADSTTVPVSVSGTVTNSYCIGSTGRPDVDGNAHTITHASFAAGEVAYLLNLNAAGGQICHQNLDYSAPYDAYPIFTVVEPKNIYEFSEAGKTLYQYSNSPINETYIVTIPAICTISEGREEAFGATVNCPVLYSSHQLQMWIESENDWNLIYSTDSLGYDLTLDGKSELVKRWSSNKAFADIIPIVVRLNDDASPRLAGTFIDHLTFHLSLEDRP